MDSRLHGVPLSATPVVPKAAGPPHNAAAAASGIRAPLTFDESDFEYSSRRNSITSSDGGGGESEGFVSGEDDYDIASEPSMVKPNGALGQQGSYGNAQESDNATGNAIFRPVVRDSDEREIKIVRNVDASGYHSRSFLSELGDEVVEDEDYGLGSGKSEPLVGVTDDEVSENEAMPVVDRKAPVLEKLQIPIAKISVDSDFESENSVVSDDDDGFSGVFRLPSFEILQRLSSTPKARPSDISEGDGHDFLDENVVDMEFVEGQDLGSKDEKEHFGVDDNPNDYLISSDFIQDKESKANFLIIAEEHNSKSEQESNETRLHSGEVIREIDVIGEPTDLGCNNSVASTAELGCLFTTAAPMEPEVTELECSSSNFGSPSVDGDHNFKFEKTEKTEILNPPDLGNVAFTSSVEELKCPCEAAKLVKPEVTESGCISEFEAASMENIMASDELENEIEEHVDIMEVCTDFFPQASKVSKVLAENMQLDISDGNGLLNDASLTDLSNGCEFGFQGKKLSEQNPPRRRDLYETLSTNGKCEEALSEAETQQLEKLQQIRVKYLWLLHRLGCSPDDSVPSKVLYELTLGEERISSQACHLDSAKKGALKFEAQIKDDLDCSMCILVIGKTGAGKSSTVNSIFGEKKTATDAFEPATTYVREIVGVKDGVKLKVIDTPGLRSSLKDQSANRRILFSIKRLMRKSPPDVILYVDRLDTQASDLNELPVLKLVTRCLGSSIWQKSILVLTHATSIPPDGPDGNPLSYDTFVAQRSCFVQQLISHSVGDFLMMNPDCMIPVSVAENHPIAEHNRHMESWKSQLLILCYSMKTLSEVRSVVTIQTSSDIREMNGIPPHSPSQSNNLSLLLQPNVHGKPSSVQSGKCVNIDSGLDYSSRSDQEEDIGRDNFLPVKPPKETRVSKLTRDKRAAYLQEYHYLANLIQKKQMRGDLTLPDFYWDNDCGYHWDKELTREGFDIHTSRENLPYILKGETEIMNFNKNNAAAEISIAFLNENEVLGLKVEDQIEVGNHLTLMGNAGFVASQDDTAYGTNVELCRTDKDYPIPLHQLSLGLSILKHKGDFIWGCSMQSKFSVGSSSKLNIKAGLNNKRHGQISMKTSCSDQLQVAALALLPVVKAIFDKLLPQSDKDSLA